MDKVEKAIETTAPINAKRQLVLDGPLPVVGPKKVRVIMFLQEETGIDEKEWLKLASVEDIYNPSDGKPFHG